MMSPSLFPDFPTLSPLSFFFPPSNGGEMEGALEENTVFEIPLAPCVRY